MAEKLKYDNWRPLRDGKPPLPPPKPGETPKIPPSIPATKIFDQLSFIGNEWVGAYILETPDGLLMIDCMEDDPRYVDIIMQGYEDLGLDISQLKYILITHGHGDHYGRAKDLRDRYGCKIYMSKIDSDYARDPATPRPGMFGPMDFEPDGYLGDMDVFSFGGYDILSVFTPGHSPGTLSFIFGVTDCGVHHTVAMWGGTGLPRSREWLEVYKNSCEYFEDVCFKWNVDVVISAHPCNGNIKERINVIQNIYNGTPNPFVIGKEGAANYQRYFKEQCIMALKKFDED